MWKDAVLICLISAGSTLLSEGISYFLIYNKPAYKQLKEKIEKNYKLTQKMLREGTDEKIRIRLEKEMKKDNTALSGMKIYSLIFFSILMFALYQFLKSSYNGIVVAKLPLIPYSFLTRMTHTGLTTQDMTDCSFGFIYGLSTLAIRSNIMKMIGGGTPKGVGSLFDQISLTAPDPKDD